MMHPFELAGLGVAPFALANVEHRPGTCCDYCGTRIHWRFHLRSTDERRFVVGSDCVERIASNGVDTRLLTDVQAGEKAAKRRKTVANRLDSALDELMAMSCARWGS